MQWIRRTSGRYASLRRVYRLERATFIVFAVLLGLFALRQFAWWGMLGVGLVAGVLATVAWVSSPYLRLRVTNILVELRAAAAI